MRLDSGMISKSISLHGTAPSSMIPAYLPSFFTCTAYQIYPALFYRILFLCIKTDIHTMFLNAETTDTPAIPMISSHDFQPPCPRSDNPIQHTFEILYSFHVFIIQFTP